MHVTNYVIYPSLNLLQYIYLKTKNICIFKLIQKKSHLRVSTIVLRVFILETKNYLYCSVYVQFSKILAFSQAGRKAQSYVVCGIYAILVQQGNGLSVKLLCAFSNWEDQLVSYKIDMICSQYKSCSVLFVVTQN